MVRVVLVMMNDGEEGSEQGRRWSVLYWLYLLTSKKKIYINMMNNQRTLKNIRKQVHINSIQARVLLVILLPISLSVLTLKLATPIPPILLQ